MSMSLSISSEHKVFSSRVFHDYNLEFFGFSYLVDLIPIPMGDVCVLIGIEWLSIFGALIDCER